MESKQIVNLLTALAQESRLAVFRLLVQQGPLGLSAGKISEQLGLPPATLSFHLKEMHHAGLVQSRQEGRFVYYSADFAMMSRLIGFLTENCCQGSACESSDPSAASCGDRCA